MTFLGSCGLDGGNIRFYWKSGTEEFALTNFQIIKRIVSHTFLSLVQLILEVTLVCDSEVYISQMIMKTAEFGRFIFCFDVVSVQT